MIRVLCLLHKSNKEIIFNIIQLYNRVSILIHVIIIKGCKYFPPGQDFLFTWNKNMIIISYMENR